MRRLAIRPIYGCLHANLVDVSRCGHLPLDREQFGKWSDVREHGNKNSSNDNSNNDTCRRNRPLPFPHPLTNRLAGGRGVDHEGASGEIMQALPSAAIEDVEIDYKE